MAIIKGEFVSNKELYMELMRTSNDFENITKKLYVLARIDTNVDDYDFFEIKRVYFDLERKEKAKKGSQISL